MANHDTTSTLPAPHTRHAHDLVHLTAATRAVLDALVGAGMSPMIVGGSVRDALMGHGNAPKDIDIEVYNTLDVDTLAATLRPLGRVDAVGRSFGVLKMVLGDGTDLDISVPRRESKTGTGHRGFTVEIDTPDRQIHPAEATGRRDFTINAMMWDFRTGNVIDYWGGLDDLTTATLRHCTDAFADDPLRVLRGVQFAARFGYTMHPDTIALCRTLTGEFPTLASERVWGEWAKLLTKGTHLSSAMTVLDATGWLDLFPHLPATRGLAQDPDWHPEGDVFTHLGLAGDEAAKAADAAGLTGTDRLVVVAAALVHDLGKITHTQTQPDGRITSIGHAEAGVQLTRDFLTAIGAPTVVRQRITPLVAEHMCATSTIGAPSRPAVRRLARRLAPATLAEWSLVCGADQAGRGAGAKANNTLAWIEVAATLGVERQAAARIVRGEHLLDLGYRPSPGFSHIMDLSIQAQDNEEFTDEPGAIAWLTALHHDGTLVGIINAHSQAPAKRTKRR